MRLRNFEKPGKNRAFHGLVRHSITTKGDRVVDAKTGKLVVIVNYKSLQVHLYRELESISLQKVDRMANTMRSKKIDRMEYYI